MKNIFQNHKVIANAETISRSFDIQIMVGVLQGENNPFKILQILHVQEKYDSSLGIWLRAYLVQFQNGYLLIGASGFKNIHLFKYIGGAVNENNQSKIVLFDCGYKLSLYSSMESMCKIGLNNIDKNLIGLSFETKQSEFMN